VLTLTSRKTLTLKSVKHVPSIFKNLVSKSLLCDVRMRQDEKVVLSYKKMYFGNAYSTDGMYKISTIVSTSIINEISNFEYSSTLWHNRLGHVNYMKMLNTNKLGLLHNCGGNKPAKCEVCIQAKITRKPFLTVKMSTNLLELIYSDTCDFKAFVTRGGMKYFITFIDDYSRLCHVYLLKSNEETFRRFIEFRTRVQKQLGHLVKKLRSDRGGEYWSHDAEVYLKEHGIIVEKAAPYSPQSNGIAERKYLIYIEMVNSMLIKLIYLPAIVERHC